MTLRARKQPGRGDGQAASRSAWRTGPAWQFVHWPTSSTAGGDAIDEFSLQVLRRSELCRGLNSQQIQRIADAVRPLSVGAGEIICRQGERGDTMYVVTRGRVQISVERGGEPYRLLDYLGRGAHFGEMAVLTDGLRTATARAAVDTQLLALDRKHFDRLLTEAPVFAANLSRSLGFRLHWETSRRHRPDQPAIVALVNSSARTQRLARLVVEALAEQGERVELLTDRGETWSSQGKYLVERIPAGGDGQDRARLVDQRVHQVLGHVDRVLLDLTQTGLEQELPRLLSSCEQIWWLVEPRYHATTCQNLRKLLVAAPNLAGRVHLVWALPDGERFAPPRPEKLDVARLDFKVTLADDEARPHRQQRYGVTRLVRHLRGTRLGLALSGGGARGLAHLGVLRAMEREGVFFDHLAGTSVGALMGMPYAGGWSPDEAIESFREALTPARWLRKMPGGARMFMWTMFRTGGWNAKLRPYLAEATLEQLQTPLCVVAVDLITGRQVVRDRGDVINAVLESINLPTIARPILRDGMALVDGGVLNNLPADVLPDRGAALVVGVDVASRLPHEFGGNKPGTPTERMKRAGPLETLLRVNEVQAYGITAMRAGAVDLMITPETASFDFADFSRARELADVGDAAATEAMPQLRQMLADLGIR